MDTLFLAQAQCVSCVDFIHINCKCVDIKGSKVPTHMLSGLYIDWHPIHPTAEIIFPSHKPKLMTEFFLATFIFMKNSSFFFYLLTQNYRSDEATSLFKKPRYLLGVEVWNNDRGEPTVSYR